MWNLNSNYSPGFIGVLQDFFWFQLHRFATLTRFRSSNWCLRANLYYNGLDSKDPNLKEN